jgi:hypothetical protein
MSQVGKTVSGWYGASIALSESTHGDSESSVASRIVLFT